MRQAAMAAGCALVLAACGDGSSPPPASSAGHDTYYADATPDISGVWRPDYTPGNFQWMVDGVALPGRDREMVWNGIPYTPGYLKAYQTRQASSMAGRPYGEPHFDCWPRGAVHQYVGGEASMAITQTPGRVQQIFEEDSQVRNIYTDGRAMPPAADPANADYAPTMNGYSVGRWDGDTLVVETRGVRKELTLGFLAPHSDAMHVTERIRRVDADHLAVDLTVEDAKALEKPLTTHLTFHQDRERGLGDSVCAENNINGTDAEGVVTVVMEPRRPPGWDLPE